MSMTSKCRTCGGEVEYVEFSKDGLTDAWWQHTDVASLCTPDPEEV